MTGKEEGERLLKLTAEADQKWRDARESLEARLREAMATELDGLRVQRDVLAYQTRLAGIPVTRIAREGLHTKARDTAYQAIKTGEIYAPKEPEAEAREFAFVDGRVRVTPPEAVLAPLLPRLGIDPADMEGAPELLYADFKVSDNGEFVVPHTDAWHEGLAVRHPVVALVNGEGSDYRQRILEWVA